MWPSVPCFWKHRGKYFLGDAINVIITMSGPLKVSLIIICLKRIINAQESQICLGRMQEGWIYTEAEWGFNIFNQDTVLLWLCFSLEFSLKILHVPSSDVFSFQSFSSYKCEICFQFENFPIVSFCWIINLKFKCTCLVSSRNVLSLLNCYQLNEGF